VTTIPLHRQNIITVSVFIPFVDHFLQQLRERFLNHRTTLSHLKNLIPATLTKLEGGQREEIIEQTAEAVSTQWPDELTACDAVLAKEIDLWRRLWIERKAQDRPRSFIDALHHCEQNMFPQVFNFLQIGATLPVSVATVERSFSTLNRLKSYLRNSCGEDRLNGLALMTILREKMPPVEEVLKFFSQKPRRFDL